MNGLYKTELIRRQGPWRTVEQVELATLEYVWWWNNRRLDGDLDLRAPPKSRPGTTLTANHRCRPPPATENPRNETQGDSLTQLAGLADTDGSLLVKMQRRVCAPY